MVLQALGFGAGMSAVSGVLQPFVQIATYELNKQLQHIRPTPAELAIQRFRGEITESVYFTEMAENGFSKTRATAFFNSSKNVASIDAVIIRLRRGLITKEQAQTDAFRAGFGITDFNKILEATEYIYTPQDLIRFYVREVYTEEIRKKYRLDEEFDKLDLKPAGKIGISQDVLKDYWAAHWDLPSIERMSEAFYRYAPDIVGMAKDELESIGLTESDVVTDDNDIKTLLKTQDVMPYYRNRVYATLYQNLGVIETRWLIRFRFVDYNRAVYLYRRRGLPQSDAELVAKIAFVVNSIGDWIDAIKFGSMSFDDVKKELAEWNITEKELLTKIEQKINPAKLESISQYRDLSLSKIVKGLKQGQIDREKAIELIKKLKYDEATAKFIIEVELYDAADKKTTKEKNITKSDIIAAFKVDTMTEKDAFERLMTLYGTKEEAQVLIDIAKAQKIGKSDKDKIKEKDLTKSDILRSLKLGVRNAQDAFDALVLLRYSQDEALELVEQTLTQSAITAAKK